MIRGSVILIISFANEAGLNWAINKDIGRYQLVWKVDGDDIYADNCHEAGKRVRQQTGAVIVGVDQHEFDDDIRQARPLISPRHQNRKIIKAEDILHKNRFGFGNTFFDPSAVREIAPNNHVGMADLSPIFIGALDWLFYTPLILAGAKAVYTDETHVLYRQHEQNELGNNSKGVEHNIRAKAEFYPEIVKRANLTESDAEIYSNLGEIFESQVQILDDPEFNGLREQLMLENYNLNQRCGLPLEW